MSRFVASKKKHSFIPKLLFRNMFGVVVSNSPLKKAYGPIVSYLIGTLGVDLVSS